MFKSRSQVHNRQTRSSGALDIPLCRLSTGQRSFAFRGAKLWNSLNDNIKSLKCPRNFRRHLANVLLSWYIFWNYNIIVLTFLINLYNFVFFILLSWKAHFGSINKVYLCMYVCMYVCVYVCVYVCMYVCVYVCMYVCMYVCYVCMYVCILKIVRTSQSMICDLMSFFQLLWK